ncbi:MAG: magnesium protoporphyrin IX methyltransferase, partial [Beijerinckiaceae bacterium]|nr:magnesium protoporphyrin IX methyltransferase [Beijerinckiaceae bacterium]
RGQLETYFDRTAVRAWEQLTSDAPVSGIRATVRAGRDRTRSTLLDWLPADLAGKTLLDAGCGTGALAVEAARRGAHVTAIDLSPKLVSIAGDRLPHTLGSGRIEFLSGDMLDAGLGDFDHVVGMDSLIHYRADDVVQALSGLAARTRHSIVFTFAPGSLALSAMLAMGRLFPRADRSPAIQPTAAARLTRLIEREPSLQDWRIGRTQRISSGFYISQPLELLRR